MNRRESICSMIAGLVGAKVAPGATVEEIENKTVQGEYWNPLVALVVKTPCEVSEEVADRIRAAVAERVGEDCPPVIVCPNGTEFVPIYASGSQAKYTYRVEVDGSVQEVGFQTKEELDEWKRKVGVEKHCEQLSSATITDIEIAARVWCAQDMRSVVMDKDAAIEIASIIRRVRSKQGFA